MNTTAHRAALLALSTAPALAQEGRVPIPGPPPGLPITGRCEASTAPPLAGSLVVVDKFQASITVVDLPTGETVATIPVGHGPHELAVSPDETRALVCNYGFTALSNSISLVDLETLSVLETFELDAARRPHDVWWTDDRVLVTTEGTNSVIELDPVTGRVLKEYDVGRPTAHMLALDLVRGVFFTANVMDGSVSRCAMTDGEPGAPEVATFGGTGEGIALTPDNAELWVTDGGQGLVRVIDPETLEETATIACEGRPHRVRFTLDGSAALVTCLDTNDVALIDTGTREVVARVANPPEAVVAIDPAMLGMAPGSALPSAIRLHPDGVHALVANINSNTVTVIDLTERKPVGVLRTGFGADGMAITSRRFGEHAAVDGG